MILTEEDILDLTLGLKSPELEKKLPYARQDLLDPNSPLSRFLASTNASIQRALAEGGSEQDVHPKSGTEPQA